MDVENLIRRSVAGMEPPTYPGPEPGVLRLDANTNLIGRNPALDRAARRIGEIDFNQYPSCLSDDLRAALAKEHGVAPEQILAGDGSDEVLDVVFKTFCSPGDLIGFPAPTFVMYSFFARLHLGNVIEAPLRPPAFELDVDLLLRVRPKILLIASPNNPTGNAFSKTDLERLILESPGLVVIDEAYADFCGQDFASHVNRFENLIVTRTFSKSHGLAAIRVGYAVSSRKVMERMYCAKTPLTLGTFSETVALEALADKTFMHETVRVVQAERARLSGLLGEAGFRPAKSDANFLIVDLGVRVDGAMAFLRSKGIVARDMGEFNGLGNYLRVTVGRPEHSDRLVAALKEWRSSCSR